MQIFKNNLRSTKGLLFTFAFILTTSAGVSTMAVPVMASNTPKTVAAAEREVWQSATGKCYHSINNCGSMNPNKAVKIKESKAKANGLRKCKKCW